ncbi:sodium-dependent phosphate transport protein, partial [Kipferlia bialata]
GVILGASIGTTITAQIVAFKVTEYAPILIFIGFVMMATIKRETPKQTGCIVLGLGFIFLGMQLMSDATYPLRSYDPFIDFMKHLENPLLAAGAAAVFTAVVQSSSATTGVVIMLASQGFIALEAGIALILGANVGTYATALLAAIGKPRPALQAACVHIFFRLVGALIWIGVIDILAAMASTVA